MYVLQTLKTLGKKNKINEISNINNILLDIVKIEKIHRAPLKQLLRMNFFTLSDLINDYKMIGSEEPMSLKFDFQIKQLDGSYFM